MPRQPRIPQLSLHKASGKAVVRLNGRDHYLGVFGSPDAKTAYDRLIAEWLANGRRVALGESGTLEGTSPCISVNEVLLAFWRHAERHYRLPDGTPTSEIREAKPKLSPGERYTPTTYAHAVRKAARKAGVPHWHPNQLRHLFATEVRRVYGLEAAQVLLGHARADITQVYAECNLARALIVAKEIG